MDVLDAAITGPLEGGPSFSLRNRLSRLCWNVTWFVFASWTPPFMHKWRRFLLHVFGAKVARNAKVYGSARIWYPPNLEIGNFACIGRQVNVYCMATVKLGDYSIISQGAHICSGTHDIEDRNFQLKTRRISIGARVWIAAEAFVGPGVNVGDGAVLGARACALRDLAPWTVYSGNPAKPIKQRRIRFSIGPALED